MFKDGWIKTDPPINLIGYVNGFRHRLYVAGELARGTLAVLQAKMKERYDRHAKVHEFSPGDKVLALCPLVSSPFQAKFSGPFAVAKRVLDENYLISTPGHRKPAKLFDVVWTKLVQPSMSASLIC